MMQKKIIRITFASSILLFTFPVMGAPVPVAPDAGQTVRELQKQPELSVPKSTAPLRPEQNAAPETKTSADLRVMVKALHVTGNSVFTSVELEALLANLVGGEHTLAELSEGAARITAYYHQRGYILARAYLPPQEIKDGTVTINVLEGHIGEQRIENQSRLSDQRADEYLKVIKSGEVLQAAPVERALLLLNETPGVGAARATLQPGASVGASDLVVQLIPSAAYAANIQLDNYGNYYTGENRLGAELVLNSPLKLGDQITLRALTSNQNLTYVYGAYQIPVGGSGLRVGGAYSATRYRLGKELAVLQSQGTATIASLFAVYPFIRSQNSNLSGTFTLEDKKLEDVIAFTTAANKQVQAATIGLIGNRQDAFWGGGVTLFDLSLVSGSLSMDPVSKAIDDLTTRSNGAFMHLNYNLNRLQRLTDRYSLSITLSGQYANKNLNSSEQFSLGGVNGVRAYPQGEAYGDEGRLVTVELRRSFTQSVQGVMFYDAGSVVLYHDPYLAGANTRFLSGGGVGVNAEIVGVEVKAIFAMRGSGGQATSEPLNVNNKSRWWLQLGKHF